MIFGLHHWKKYSKHASAIKTVRADLCWKYFCFYYCFIYNFFSDNVVLRSLRVNGIHRKLETVIGASVELKTVFATDWISKYFVLTLKRTQKVTMRFGFKTVSVKHVNLIIVVFNYKCATKMKITMLF